MDERNQTVYLYGSSNGQWTCVWDSYHGQWQPPGCPGHHDFYTTNQINSQGYTNAYEGTAWNPAQYMNIAHEFDSPVGRNDGSETVHSNAAVICSVAGAILPASVTNVLLFVRFGSTYEAWNNTMGTVAGRPTCNVFAVCSNGRPYLVDLPYVILFGISNNTCSPGFTCYGICVRAAPAAQRC